MTKQRVVRSGVSNTAKGVVIGSALLVPGVSGGTTAIILGIYDKLIIAVSTFFKNPKKSLFLLGTVSVGGILGILLFSRLLLFVTTAYEMPMMFLFLGAIVGSVPLMCRKAEVHKLTSGVIVYPIIGAGLVLLLAMLPKDLLVFNAGSLSSYGILVLAGIVLSVAFVLPGISVSYMLLVLGIYQPTLMAIDQMNLAFLITLGLSVLIGIALTTKVLEYTMTKHAQPTFLLIIGFVLGSLKDVFPGIPQGIDLLICPIMFLAGLGIILFVSQFANE